MLAPALGLDMALSSTSMAYGLALPIVALPIVVLLLTRDDDEFSVSPKRKKTMDLYMKEREGKPNADCQSRSPMPSTSAEPSSSQWGQANLVGAGEANGGRKLPASCPSPPAPNTREATGPNP
jgi:hypothetical protein